MNTTFEFEKKQGMAIMEGEAACSRELEMIQRKTEEGAAVMKSLLASYYAESINHSISFSDYIGHMKGDVDEALSWKDYDFG